MHRRIAGIVLSTLLIVNVGWAKPKHHHRHRTADATLGVEFVKMKAKGGWTTIVLALQNQGTADTDFECCQMYIENDAGYAVQALSRDEMQVLIHNRARTASIIGELVGAGLGIGGAIGGVDELVYAGVAVGLGSAIVGVAGDAAKEGQQRSLVIDDIMRNQNFPAGLKIAGVAYFPPKKKWPDSKVLQAIHVTYKLHGKQHRVTVPVE